MTAAPIQAALVTTFGTAPTWTTIPAPTPRTPEDIAVEVLAVPLHNRMRSAAAGAHYTSTGRLPMIPGTDAVGRLDDGRLVYFVADDDADGTLAERAIADTRRMIPLHDGADLARIAAGMNPAMSSWVALRRRVELAPGASVLVLGATGNAGTMAVSIARLFGAGRVIGAGRDTARLADSGADATIPLTDDAEATATAFAENAAEVDVVLDYLWGEPSAAAMSAILTARSDRSRRLDWVEIGSAAGPTAPLPSAAFRSADLHLLGSGQGSVSPRAYLGELPDLVAAIDDGRIPVAVRTRPMAEVETVWGEPDEPGVRTVLTRGLD